MVSLVSREVIKDELIPKAVSWYTGEAVNDEEDEEEEDDDDEVFPSNHCLHILTSLVFCEP